MEISTQDRLKKTLLDTQERVRDFMHFSDEMQDNEMGDFFRQYALTEAEHARKLQEYIEINQ
ncbi:hypothetical protein [Sinanaerobacter sp. ZZT-01]|uniref:hypothetical protein n=1 Tax=Sinanaerobacter sp. ZZT-01 TaxID=3111540 RepID=UPI002D7A0E90|nr:hypothetical protein [Sinanaerobacter sp. ZZT-01]WRR94124.1 hypothetical protein U5921_03120 [Sinanaerobacter sp. ZZT-01]